LLEIGLPVIFAILVWWLSTGVILYLDGLGPRTFRASMLWATGATALAFAALAFTRDLDTVTGAYVAFCAAVMIWGWNEMAFLMGYLSGPNRQPCPPDARGFRRFGLALRTVIDHELAIALSAGLIMLTTLNGANQIGLWTFGVLWVMRISAKLNIFLGAPNVPTEFLPPHLAYLKSYFRRRPMNGLFPVAITAATLFTAFLVHMAMSARATGFETAGYLLLTTMMALAVLEHWLLFIPLSASALWGWGLKSHERALLEQGQGAGGEGDASTWSLTLAEPCDPRELGLVLNDVISGRFGDVSRLDGAARSRDGWLTFRIADGRATLNTAGLTLQREGRVTAVGRNVDEARLSAAFLACAA
jgi:putative photosynthetic complex assembly protein 2